MKTSILSKKDYFLVFLLLFSVLLLYPINAMSGSTGPSYLNVETENSSFQLFYYWDLRNRDSSFQVFNNSSTSAIKVHVQIFTANSTINECEENDFHDNFTPLDTHNYDLRNLTKNDGTKLRLLLPDNSFGFAVVSVFEETGPDYDTTKPVLIGSFRIVDRSGYEYRANPAGVRPIGFTTDSYSFNIQDFGGANFSDVIGIPIKYDDTSPFRFVTAGPDIAAVFDPLIFDNNENSVSCSPVRFSCSASGLNKGIDVNRPNSKGVGPPICPPSFSNGHMLFSIPFLPAVPAKQADFFVGFIGLNNGAKMGSMTTFIAAPPF